MDINPLKQPHKVPSTRKVDREPIVRDETKKNLRRDSEKNRQRDTDEGGIDTYA